MNREIKYKEALWVQPRDIWKSTIEPNTPEKILKVAAPLLDKTLEVKALEEAVVVTKKDQLQH